MTARRRWPQFSLLGLLAIPLVVVFFLQLTRALMPKLEWWGILLFYLLTSPFWLMIGYGFYGAVHGFSGAKDHHDRNARLPENLPEDLTGAPEDLTAPAPSGRRKRHLKAKPRATWWSPRGGWGK